MSQYNDHHDDDDSEMAKAGDINSDGDDDGDDGGDGSQRIPTSTIGIQPPHQMDGASGIQLNDRNVDDDFSDARQDAMIKRRQEVVDYLDDSDRLIDAGNVAGNVNINATSQAYQQREEGSPCTNDEPATSKEKEMNELLMATLPYGSSGRTLDLSPTREKEVQSASKASETDATRAHAENNMAMKAATNTSPIEREGAGAVKETEMRLRNHNEAQMIQDTSTHAGKAQQQHLHGTRTMDEESDSIAASAQTDASHAFAARDSMLAPSTLTSTTSDGAASSSTFSSTVIPHTMPTNLVRAQPNANQPNIRPGAIRVVQGAGGAYMERTNVTMASVAEAEDDEPSQVTNVNNETDRTPEYPTPIAATLVEESIDDGDDLGIAEIEEARRTGAERAKRTLLKDAVVADAVVTDMVEDADNSRLSTYLIIASICVVIAVGAIVGAVVGSSSSGNSSVSSSASASTGALTATPTLAPITAQPTASSANPSEIASSNPTAVVSLSPSSSPSQSPTTQPTAQESSMPTTTYDNLVSRKINRIVMTVSDASRFADPSSYQLKALNWLLVEDEWITLETEERLVKQRYVLVLFSLLTRYDNWERQYNFMDPETSICDWGRSFNPISRIPALSCSGLERVRSISLVNNSLDGPIPTEIGVLDSLDTLHFGSNSLSGPLPSEVGELANLQAFQVGHNKLTGTVPTEFGNLQILREVHFAGNWELHGPIPSQMNTIRTLLDFVIEFTQLTGVQVMCETDIPFWSLRSDCKSEALTCTCCTRCCRNGNDCEDTRNPNP